ncbi:AraC family transcriptional regulator [Rhizobium sp. LjRoot30]|uniref:AraC family transcriptional regulator n=1 Tax=Rhizobium sp. LjRoot30 TaxID=3342320 RepID=UPI003ECE32A3
MRRLNGTAYNEMRSGCRLLLRKVVFLCKLNERLIATCIFDGVALLKNEPELAERHIVGDDTHQMILRARDSAVLRAAHIEHVGISDAAAPYSIVRTELAGTFLLGTIAGEGRMLLDGEWQAHTPGRISLAPAMSLHAFHAVPGIRWKTCWVRFSPRARVSQTNTIVPLIIEADCNPLKCAIEGLQHETADSNNSTSEMLWGDLIQHYVMRVTSRINGDARIYAAFEAVQNELARAWTVEDLAEAANLSTEHFRRLCVRTLGRSPMRQVTALRVQRAAHLLTTTNEKIEAIASDVGYVNPFAFSNTFKKITGFRPSTMRENRMEAQAVATEIQPPTSL